MKLLCFSCATLLAFCTSAIPSYAENPKESFTPYSDAEPGENPAAELKHWLRKTGAYSVKHLVSHKLDKVSRKSLEQDEKRRASLIAARHKTSQPRVLEFLDDEVRRVDKRIVRTRGTRTGIKVFDSVSGGLFIFNAVDFVMRKTGLMSSEETVSEVALTSSIFRVGDEG